MEQEKAAEDEAIVKAIIELGDKGLLEPDAQIEASEVTQGNPGDCVTITR